MRCWTCSTRGGTSVAGTPTTRPSRPGSAASTRREYLLGEIKKACGYRERMEFDTSNSHPGVEHY